MDPIPDVAGIALSGAEAIARSLHSNLIDWQIRPQSKGAVIASIKPFRAGGIRLIEFSGAPLEGERRATEISGDKEAYLGVLFQRSGQTICDVGGERTIVGPGDISIWHSQRPARFMMPTPFHKTCVLIPMARLESVLPRSESYEGQLLCANTPLARVLGACLQTLSEGLDVGAGNLTDETVEVTLHLLSAAFQANRLNSNASPRQLLRERILRYMEARLEDPKLSPAIIASANGISLRYLYVLFAEEGITVSGWIRQRRLAKCRAEFEISYSRKTVTEIAFRWGFNDAAHFSNLFRAQFGMSPSDFIRSKKCAGRYGLTAPLPAE